jgi:preprotein translocase subunit SecG
MKRLLVILITFIIIVVVIILIYTKQGYKSGQLVSFSLKNLQQICEFEKIAVVDQLEKFYFLLFIITVAAILLFFHYNINL